jgi:hypothetical protein
MAAYYGYGVLGLLALLLWPVGLLVDGAWCGLARRPAVVLPMISRLADLDAAWSATLLRAPPRALLARRVAELTETRAGAVAAHSAELRRIEMDLAELRHVVRGIHPPILTDRGLAGAVRALAASSGPKVTVQADDLDEGRGGAHGPGTRAASKARHGDQSQDESQATAAKGSGSGLPGMGRRVAALDGTFTVTSPRGPDGSRGRAAMRVVIAEDNACRQPATVPVLSGTAATTRGRTSSAHSPSAASAHAPQMTNPVVKAASVGLPAWFVIDANSTPNTLLPTLFPTAYMTTERPRAMPDSSAGTARTTRSWVVAIAIARPQPSKPVPVRKIACTPWPNA